MSAPQAHENFWAFDQEHHLVFLLYNTLVYVFPRTQNETLKKECCYVRIRGTFLAKKGAQKLSIQRAGGHHWGSDTSWVCETLSSIPLGSRMIEIYL